MARITHLAEAYLRSGALDTGLALLTRSLKTDPTDIWTYNTLARCLPDVGLARLLGHKSLDTTKIYTQPTPGELAQRGR